jgi:hypothetical protein
LAAEKTAGHRAASLARVRPSIMMHDGNSAVTSVQHHYETHLAPIYQWMLGGWNAALARGEADLAGLLPDDLTGRMAVDLGAGIGLHTVPLARRGCEVLAIDTSARLLRTLRRRGRGLPIRPVQANLMSFQSFVNKPADLILCMGDTLTHLQDLPTIEQLLRQVTEALADDGQFIATFRDYTDLRPGARRFVNVGGGSGRILTCYLEYADQHVNVHDLVHERENGSWSLSVSAYQKSRLSPEWVGETLAAHGFVASLEPPAGGMIKLVARRQPQTSAPKGFARPKE